MSNANSPATKADVEDAIREITPGIVTEIVTKVVTDVVDGAKVEILSAVGDQFDIVNDRLDGVETRLDGVETRLDRVENKLDKVADKVVDTERVKVLESKAA